MKKRGEISALTKLIIAIIVGLALLVLYFGIFAPSLYTGADRENCRISVEAKAKTKVVQDSPLISDLACRTQFVEVTDKAIRKNDKIIETLGKEPEYRVKKAIANEMYDCWYQMGEGKLDPWSDWGTNTRHCIVCSEIRFDGKAQQKFGTIKDFDKFLCSEKITNKDLTYCRYFSGKDEFEKVQIDTKNEYSILYSLNDISNLGTVAGYTTGGCAAGASIGFFVGIVGAIPGAIGGCLGGVISGVYESAFGQAKTQVQAGMFIAPTKSVDMSQCDLLY